LDWVIYFDGLFCGVVQILDAGGALAATWVAR
jgi:hypothetical protein